MCKLIGSFALAIINLLFLIISIILIIVGALLQWGGDTVRKNIIPQMIVLAGNNGTASISMKELGEVISNYVAVLGNSGIIIFVIGIVLFIISFCGSFGIFCRSRVLMNIYLILTTIIWILMIIFIIVFFTNQNQLQAKGNTEYTQMLANNYIFNNGSYALSTNGLQISGIVDLLQARLQCCGSTNSRDFISSQLYNTSYGIIPYSCCNLRSNSLTPTDPNCISQPTSLNSNMAKGCFSELFVLVTNYFHYAAYSLIVLAIILFILIVMASVLQYSYKTTTVTTI